MKYTLKGWHLQYIQAIKAFLSWHKHWIQYTNSERDIFEGDKPKYKQFIYLQILWAFTTDLVPVPWYHSWLNRHIWGTHNNNTTFPAVFVLNNNLDTLQLGVSVTTPSLAPCGLQWGKKTAKTPRHGWMWHRSATLKWLKLVKVSSQHSHFHRSGKEKGAGQSQVHKMKAKLLFLQF